MLKTSMYVCCNFTPCLAKTRERVEKGKGGREGRGKGSGFPFTCLVCKGELEGNIPYWWVIQTKQV